jgi:hypothetical protein
MTSTQPTDANLHLLDSEQISALSQALRGLAYGSVEITVHRGQVTQIERRERIRFSGDAVPAQR